MRLPAVQLLTWNAVSADPMPLAPETGDTFEDNAAQKARFYAELVGLPALADDSGLVVDALDGQPGVHSARWMGETTPYEVKNARLLELLASVPTAARTARFVCVAALALPGGEVKLARGEHVGRIAEQVAGGGGFGYDPVFFSDELRATFGELPAEAKNRVSHRARAMAAIRPALLGLT